MTRADLVIEVAKIAGGSKKDAAKYVEAVLEGIVNGMKNDGGVKLANFGNFQTVVKPAHKAHNPATGETVDVPDRVFPKMKFSPSIKEMLNA
jgi:nucleoid DNA-binding protein